MAEERFTLLALWKQGKDTLQSSNWKTRGERNETYSNWNPIPTNQQNAPE